MGGERNVADCKSVADGSNAGGGGTTTIGTGGGGATTIGTIARAMRGTSIASTATPRVDEMVDVGCAASARAAAATAAAAPAAGSPGCPAPSALLLDASGMVNMATTLTEAAVALRARWQRGSSQIRERRRLALRSACRAASKVLKSPAMVRLMATTVARVGVAVAPSSRGGMGGKTRYGSEGGPGDGDGGGARDAEGSGANKGGGIDEDGGGDGSGGIGGFKLGG